MIASCTHILIGPWRWKSGIWIFTSKNPAQLESHWTIKRKTKATLHLLRWFWDLQGHFHPTNCLIDLNNFKLGNKEEYMRINVSEVWHCWPVIISAKTHPKVGLSKISPLNSCSAAAVPSHCDDDSLVWSHAALCSGQCATWHSFEQYRAILKRRC